ncbi:MAG: undecaprenyl-phosphate glucose phosphotransferase [Gemmatales bacterium]|nr:undecaprenyl-phosphate glucose phosphotransferase [Candidatus Kapabacteria bacterium]MDW7993047.1 undecaprenyl-phosphate glucose phosphotransferase [Gemmatales bacterium]
MIRRVHQGIVWCFVLVDALLTAGAWLGAYYWRCSGWPISLYHAPPSEEICWHLTPAVVVLAVIAFRWVGLYEIHRLRRFREELAGALKGSILAVLLVLALLFFTKQEYDSRLTLAYFGVLLLGSLVTGRRLVWSIIRAVRQRGYNHVPVVIVGTGRTARQLARSLVQHRWTGLRLYGYIEDRPSRWTNDLYIVGSINDLPRLVQEKGIRQVFIALPWKRFEEARRVFSVLADSLAEVRLVVDTPSLVPFALTTTQFDGMTIVNLRESPYVGVNRFLKRLMDITISLIALIVLSPLMLVIAVMIKLTSRGPVFYRQERCGLDGKVFHMLKFRTMRVDAERETGPVFTKPNDPRRTWFGALLRRCSLDELPQLFNVLKGDMSLVGPRPERPYFVARFRKTIPHYMARHLVKAGITGWAQVNGWRGDTSLRKRLQYDLYYITHWNPWFDLRILWLTLWQGLVHRNAY